MKLTINQILKDYKKYNDFNDEEFVFFMQLFEKIYFFHVKSINECITSIKDIIDVGYKWKDINIKENRIHCNHLDIIFSSDELSSKIYPILQDWVKNDKGKLCNCGKYHEIESDDDSDDFSAQFDNLNDISEDNDISDPDSDSFNS